MRKALCSGSFDPVTNGHIDIFERASHMTDELVVCVFHNVRKQYLFSVEERMDLLREATSHIPNIRIDSSEGLVSEYMKENGIRTVIRGLRSVTDFEYEQKSAQMLHVLWPEAETVFLLTSPKYSFVNASGIRELAAFSAPVQGLVPPCVEAALLKKAGVLQEI